MSYGASVWWSECIKIGAENGISAELVAWERNNMLFVRASHLELENQAAWDSAEYNQKRAERAEGAIAAIKHIILEFDREKSEDDFSKRLDDSQNDYQDDEESYNAKE